VTVRDPSPPPHGLHDPFDRADPHPALTDAVCALRGLQARLVATAAPGPSLRRVAVLLRAAEDELRPHGTEEDVNTWDAAGTVSRSQALAPPLEDVAHTKDTVTARVTLTNFYLGGNGAAHGGAIPLLFDDVLGRLANVDRPWARTASLTTTFRAVTPVDIPLVVEGRVVQEEGRKRRLHAVLRHGETVTAEAEALFVVLRSTQV
jgi:acyl-coenzyme A thioesterase PaaI-like protein